RPVPVGDDVRCFLASLGLAEPRIQNTIWSVAFSPDGTHLASASQDGSICLWALPGRNAVRPLDRVLLTHLSRPTALFYLQVALPFVALALPALAIILSAPWWQAPWPIVDNIGGAD